MLWWPFFAVQFLGWGQAPSPLPGHVPVGYGVPCKMLPLIVGTEIPSTLIGLRRVSRNLQGGAQNLKAFFFCFSIFQGGAAQKMIISTKKVAKYRWNSLKFALMTFLFFAFQFLGGGGPGPFTRAWVYTAKIVRIVKNDDKLRGCNKDEYLRETFEKYRSWQQCH